MHTTKKFIIFLIMIVFVVLCTKNKPSPFEPTEPCMKDQPVEDTTRIYLHPYTRDTLTIYKKAVFARFYPWIKDTALIRQTVEKYKLRLYGKPYILDQQYAAVLCVVDNRRAEYHFTPYGKEGFCNFGADSLVEYAFGVFSYGLGFPSGNIIFRFHDDTPQSRIDSLFEANGLRLFRTYPEFPTGFSYSTVITPKAPKNVLDLGYELGFVPFVVWVSTEMFTGVDPINCDE